MNPALRAIGALSVSAFLAASDPALADPFVIVDSSRAADLSLEVAPSGALESASSDQLGEWQAGWSFGPFTVGTPEVALKSGSLSIEQQSLIGTSRLSFSGSGDALAWGFRNSEFAEYQVHALAFTTYSVAFDLATAVPVQLTLDSGLGGELERGVEVFDFELLRDGAVVWTDEVKHDPVTGVDSRSFTQTMLLQPGHYTLSATVLVSAGVVPDQFRVHSTAFGAFTLAAVPEPHSWASLLAGMLVVGGLLKQHRRAALA